MDFLQVQSQRPELQPDVMFSIGDFPITNAFLMTWFVIGVLFIISMLLKKKMSIVPGKFQSVIEVIIEMLHGLIKSITQSKSATKTLLPIIGTLLFFIGISNIIGSIPGLTAITFDGVAIFRTPTNDFNMTVALAICMSLLVHVATVRKIGFFTHIGNFIKIKQVYQSFKKGIGDGFLSLVDFFIGLMDIISEIAKVVSLSMRLFGNIYAGEVMAGVLYGLFAIFIPAPWLAMSLFSGIVQALVFSMLTTVFYTLAVVEPDTK